MVYRPRTTMTISARRRKKRMKRRLRTLAALTLASLLEACGGGGGGGDDGGSGGGGGELRCGEGEDTVSQAPVDFEAPLVAMVEPLDFEEPPGLAAADFDGDGRDDLAIVSREAGGLYLTGTDLQLRFATPVAANGFSRVAAVAGDFDEDGHADLILGDAVQDDMPARFFAGDGLGGLALRGSIGVLDPGPIAADFDGDGHLDLVARKPLFTEGPDVAIRFGDGTGSFGAAVGFRVGETMGIGSMRAEDMDGDGHLDLVASERRDFGDDLGYTFIVINDGRGNFSKRSRVSGTLFESDLGDFDGNGALDFALNWIYYVGSFPFSYRSVHLNDGEASTWTRSYSDRPPRPAFGAPIADDFDRDGHVDLYFSSGELLSGDGRGGFSSSATGSTVAGFDPSDCTLEADFDGDGVDDLAIVSDADVRVLLRSKSCSLRTTLPLPDIAASSGLVLADFDEDGSVDAVAGSMDPPRFYRGDGTGRFAPGDAIEPGSAPDVFRDPVAGDIDGDGHLDFVVLVENPPRWRAFSGDGAGGFSFRSETPATRSPSDPKLSDLDADGAVDLVFAIEDSNAIGVALGVGDGSFGAVSEFDAGPAPRSCVVGDLDGDGRRDDVGAGLESGVSLLFGDDSGGFGPPGFFPFAVPVVSLAAADWNEDGALDLLALSGARSLAGDVTVLAGDGTGSFVAVAEPPVTAGLTVLSIVAADFDGDGHADWAATAFDSGTLTVALGSGAGSTRYVRRFAPRLGILRVADVVTDGLPDIVLGARTLLVNTTPR